MHKKTKKQRRKDVFSASEDDLDVTQPPTLPSRDEIVSEVTSKPRKKKTPREVVSSPEPQQEATPRRKKKPKAVDEDGNEEIADDEHAPMIETPKKKKTRAAGATSARKKKSREQEEYERELEARDVSRFAQQSMSLVHPHVSCSYSKSRRMPRRNRRACAVRRTSC